MWNYYSPYGNYSTSNYSINSYYSNYSNSFQQPYDYRSISLNTHAMKPPVSPNQQQQQGFYYQISSVYQPPALDRNRQGSLHYKPATAVSAFATLTGHRRLSPPFHSDLLFQSSASNLLTRSAANNKRATNNNTNNYKSVKLSSCATTTAKAAKSGANKNRSQQNKYARSPNLDKSQLYYKYQSQKKAEHDFYALQRQIVQTESLIANNPSMATFYAAWLQQAKESLKQFTSIIESPDAVTFSVSIVFI